MIMKENLLIAITILLSNIAFTQTTYTFNGNGNWSDSTNWVNRHMPPSVLDSGSKIIINPAGNGECILDTLQFLKSGATLNIEPNKKFLLTENLVNNPTEQALGCIASDVDSLDLVPVLDTALLPSINKKMPASFALSMPSEIDLPIIESQGGSRSCVAFATAYAARSYYLHKDHCTSYRYQNGGQDLSKVLSPAFVYNQWKNKGSCKEAGMSILTALSKMKTYGVCTWEKMQYDGDNCSKPPDNAAKKNASLYTINNFWRLIDVSEATIKRVLNSGNLIMAGVTVDYAFWKYGFYIWKSKIGDEVGGHAIVVCGWNDTYHAYKIFNSWGPDWGFKGYGWIDYDYFKKVVQGSSFTGNPDFGKWDLFVMTTSPKFNVDFRISYNPTNTVGSTITFQDITEPTPASIEWSFPGGTIVPEGTTPDYTTVKYDKAGTYPVKLRANNCSSYFQTKDTVIKVASSLNDLVGGGYSGFATWTNYDGTGQNPQVNLSFYIAVDQNGVISGFMTIDGHEGVAVGITDGNSISIGWTDHDAPFKYEGTFSADKRVIEGSGGAGNYYAPFNANGPFRVVR